MLLGCSKISVSVVVKHVQHNKIIRAFCLPRGDLLSFLVSGEQKKLLGCGLQGGSVPRLIQCHSFSIRMIASRILS